MVHPQNYVLEHLFTFGHGNIWNVVNHGTLDIFLTRNVNPILIDVKSAIDLDDALMLKQPVSKHIVLKSTFLIPECWNLKVESFLTCHSAELPLIHRRIEHELIDDVGAFLGFFFRESVVRQCH